MFALVSIATLPSREYVERRLTAAKRAGLLGVNAKEFACIANIGELEAYLDGVAERQNASRDRVVVTVEEL